MTRGLLCTPEDMRGWLDGSKNQFRVPVKPQPPAGFEAPYQDSNGAWRVCDNRPPDILETFPLHPPYAPGDLVYCCEAWRIWAWHEGEPITVQFKDGTKHEVDGDPDDFEKYVAWEERMGTQSCADLEAAGFEPDEFGVYHCEDDVPTRWRSSTHMKPWASRHWRRILTVRAERVQETSVEDMWAEGLKIPCAEESGRVLWRVSGTNPAGKIPASYLPKGRLFPDQPPVTQDEIALAHFADHWDSRHASKGFGWDTNCWVWRYTTEEAEKP